MTTDTHEHTYACLLVAVIVALAIEATCLALLWLVLDVGVRLAG